MHFKRGIFESKNSTRASINITKPPSNGEVSSGSDGATFYDTTPPLAYTPARNFVGKDTVKFTISTPGNPALEKLGYVTSFSSVEKTFFITVK